MVSTSVRSFRAIAISLGIAVLIILFWLWMAYWNPKAAPAPAYRPVPTVTPAPNYYNVENVDDYLAGRCVVFSKDAAPEWYEQHPNIIQCRFKVVTK